MRIFSAMNMQCRHGAIRHGNDKFSVCLVNKKILVGCVPGAKWNVDPAKVVSFAIFCSLFILFVVSGFCTFFSFGHSTGTVKSL